MSTLLWWLSFADTRTDPHTFLGVAVVPGGDVADAAGRAWVIGCNPGGQVAGWPVDADPVRAARIPTAVLMTEAEALAAQRRIVETDR